MFLCGCGCGVEIIPAKPILALASSPRNKVVPFPMRKNDIWLVREEEERVNSCNRNTQLPTLPGFDAPFAPDNPKMRFSTSSVLLAASSLLGAALAHNIQLAAHGRECFHESLHVDDKMTVTFQVGDREFGSAGNLDVDFWVRHSQGKFLLQLLLLI